MPPEGVVNLNGVDLAVGDADATVSHSYISRMLYGLDAIEPSGKDGNAEPFVPAPKADVVLREVIHDSLASFDTSGAAATWDELVANFGTGLGWLCPEDERDIHEYCPADVIAARFDDGRFDTGVYLYEDKPTLVLYDVALPLREWGILERDSITKAQQATIELRNKKWGVQSAPEAVRLKRLAKLNRRFKGCRELTAASAFFREYVYLADPTPRSDATGNAAYWDALAAAGAPFVIFPQGQGKFGKRWPEPKWGVVAAYEKRHGARATAKTSNVAPSGGVLKPLTSFVATETKKLVSWVTGAFQSMMSAAPDVVTCATPRRAKNETVPKEN